MTETNYVTYQLQCGNMPEHHWIAYVVMPNGKLWMVPSFAATEKEAVDKIVALWESERAKINQITGAAMSSSQPEQHHLAGLVWVIHKNTREKKRVSPQEAEGLLAFGEWERGGPRSK